MHRRAEIAPTGRRQLWPPADPQHHATSLSTSGQQLWAGANPSPTVPLLPGSAPLPPTPHQARRRGLEGPNPRPFPARRGGPDSAPRPLTPRSLVTARGVTRGRTTAVLSTVPGWATLPPAGGCESEGIAAAPCVHPQRLPVSLR